MSSLAELRAELKNLRKSANPVPASRMKKADVAMEIARLKGKSTPAPPSTPEKEIPAPKKEKKEKVAKAPAEAPKEDAPKKTKGVKASVSEVVIPTLKDEKEKASKPTKGSEEMKARMAALRAKRSEKKTE